MPAACDDPRHVGTSNQPRMTSNVREAAERSATSPSDLELPAPDVGIPGSSSSTRLRLRTVKSPGEELTHDADTLQTTSGYDTPFLGRRPPFVDHQPPFVIGQPDMPKPAAKPKGPKLKFTPEDDELLVELRETKKMTWKQIGEFFPGRSSGTLQVRYFTRLKEDSTRDGMTIAEQLLVFDLVSAALCEDELLIINLSALSDIDIGRERFHREVQRLIKVFGQDVHSPKEPKIAKRVARTLQVNRSSAYIAQLIERQTRASVKAQSTGKTLHIPPPQTGTPTNGNTRGDGEGRVLWAHDLLLTKSVFLDSNAYCAYRNELLLFAHRPYEARVSRSIGTASKVTDRSGRVLTRPQVALLAQEISWTPTTLLTWSQDKSLCIADQFKGLVEDSMGETWNWWPLQQRVHRLGNGFWRLSWQTPHKTSRHLNVSEDARIPIQNALESAPSFLTGIRSSSVLSSATNGVFITKTATTSPGSLSQNQNAHPSTGGPATSLQLVGTPVVARDPQIHPPIITPGPAASTATYDVHLCIEAGSRRFAVLDCNGLKTDKEFFDSIKSRYNESRGWCRLWLSTWTYNYCDFFLFQKHAINSSARLRLGFPDAIDLSYDFSPRPPEYLPPDGPISHDEFNFHYYHDLCPSYFSWTRWFAASYFTSTGPSIASRTALDAVPERTSALNKEDGKRELFYGLYAKEARSAFRVVMYISLCNLPSVVFFFLWLYQWRHGSDLQGAAVPVNLSLSLTLGFLGWLYWTR